MPSSLDQLAIELFRTFARFEYALKAAGFHNGDGAAEPNWRSFAQSIPGLFDDPADPALQAAVLYILGHPPKKQVTGASSAFTTVPTSTTTVSRAAERTKPTSRRRI